MSCFGTIYKYVQGAAHCSDPSIAMSGFPVAKVGRPYLFIVICHLFLFLILYYMYFMQCTDGYAKINQSINQSHAK